MSYCFKKCTLFLLFVSVLNLLLPMHVDAKQKRASQSERSYVSKRTVKNSTKSDDTAHDTIQEEKSVVKKPTFKESWRKVLTLRWRELSRADAWNIGAPIAGVAALGVWYYWQKNIAVNNNVNSQNNNPGNDGNNLRNNGLDSDSDSSSEDDLDDNPDGNSGSIKLTENDGLNNNVRDLDVETVHIDDVLVDDVQHKIALHMISDFFGVPKTLQTPNHEYNTLFNSVAIYNNIAATASNDVRIWNRTTGELLHTLPGICSVRIQNNKVIAVAPTGQSVHVWDVNTGVLLHTLQGHTNFINSIGITRDKIVTGGCADGTVKIWDSNTGILLRTLYGQFDRVAIYDDKMVTGGWDYTDHTAKIWNANSGVLLHILRGHNQRVFGVVIQGDKVATVAGDATVKIWNANTGILLHTLQGAFTSVAIQDNKVVTGATDNTVKIWSANTGQLLQTFQGHTNFVNSVAIHDNMIISGSSDHTAKIWSLDENFVAPEINNREHPLFWIRNNIMPLQANLIARATHAGNIFLIFANTDDARTWVTFPEHVRQYLMERLNIQLTR